jgi:hypothetical protein
MDAAMLRAFFALLLGAGCGGKAVIDHEAAGGGGGAGASTGSTTTGGGGGEAPFVCPRCDEPAVAGSLQDAAIAEASGVAADASTLYVHNDSGDGPRVFRIDHFGIPLAEYTLPGASSVDWEDIALGPCPDRSACVYVGDIGDNALIRSDCAIYRFRSPPPGAGRIRVDHVWLPFVYPDGPHDAETLLVDGDGTPYVLAKVATGPSTLYRYPLPQQPGVPVTLEAVASVEPPVGIASFTAGDLRAGGLFLRTYTNVFYWPVDGDLAAAVAGAPCIVPSPPDVQGEALSWTADGSGFLTTSEGVNSPIHGVRCF